MAASPQRTGRRAAILLSLVALGYLGFAIAWVPRLTNNLMTDVAPAGWASYVAHRMVAGGELYESLVLPEPPGAFVAMAALQRATGATLLLQELWVVAIGRLVLCGLAYLLATVLGSQRVAVLVAVATLLVLVGFERQLAQDYLAQACVWASLAAGARALYRPGVARRWWIAAAAFATLTLGFEQGAAVGVLLGWLLAFALLARLGSAPKDVLRPLAIGVAWGLLGVAALVLASGGSFAGYLRSVYADGLSVRGGWDGLASDVASALFIYNGVFPSSIVLTLVLVVVGFAVVRRMGSFHMGTSLSASRPLPALSLGIIAAIALGTFGIGLMWLGSDRQALPPALVLVALAMEEVPSFGLALGLGYFAAHLGLARGPESAAERQRGHAVNALLVVAVAASIGHNLDAVAPVPLEPRFWAANPLVPLSLFFLFGTLERARLGWAQLVVLVCVATAVFGPQFERALLAQTPVTAGRYNGLEVSYRGVEVLRAVQAVQSHATREQSVLVLPEDPQLALLMARPRPALQGAIVLPGEYPARLASHDIATLESQPPQVIVLHPRRERSWRRLFAAYSESDGAARVVTAARDLLRRRYRRVGSFRSVYLWDQGFIEVWVKRTKERP